MAASLRRAIREVIVERGWAAGSELEDRVCRLLMTMGEEPQRVEQQLRVGRYRLDFAWPGVKVALEVDGPRHLYDPQVARKDAERDAWLRGEGWLVLRVDDDRGDEEVFAGQVLRVVLVVRHLDGRVCAGSARQMHPRR